LTRRLIVRFSILVIALVVSALLIEWFLEAHDVNRLMPGQTFVQVGNSRIRYKLMGVNNRGAVVVFLSGLAGSLEQADKLQTTVSTSVPSLAYDRAGYGFSEGSSAHSAAEQAEELAGLLDALKIDKPVVLAAYSNSGELARVFASRYPEKVGYLYLIEPWMPELSVWNPKRWSVRRYYGRTAIQDYLKSVVGLMRLSQRLKDWKGPESLVDQRTEAGLARRSHNWGVLAEWYERPLTARQAIAATVHPEIPIEIIFTKGRFQDEESNRAEDKMFADLAARSRYGTLVEFEHVEHTRLMEPSLMFDPMAARIKQLSLKVAP
jgi:pimeloyl-ACP methyl ester carboxylesterase